MSDWLRTITFWLSSRPWINNSVRNNIYLGIPSIHGAVEYKRSPFLKCPKCHKRKWVEDIILNCGICTKCFDKSWNKYVTENCICNSLTGSVGCTVHDDSVTYREDNNDGN